MFLLELNLCNWQSSVLLVLDLMHHVSRIEMNLWTNMNDCILRSNNQIRRKERQANFISIDYAGETYL